MGSLERESAERKIDWFAEIWEDENGVRLGHSCNEPNLSKLFFMFRRAFFESDRGQGIMRGMWAGLGDH